MGQSPAGDLVPPTIRLRRWRLLAGLSLAASLVMGSLLLFQQTRPFIQDNSSGFNVVSVLRSEDGTDLWAILAETATGHIRAVALQPPAESLDNSHQLWVILPDDAGVQSVGLLPYGNGNVGTYDLVEAVEQSNLLEGSAFAISLEPYGGTEESAPTGPVVSVREYTRLSDEI